MPAAAVMPSCSRIRGHFLNRQNNGLTISDGGASQIGCSGMCDPIWPPLDDSSRSTLKPLPRRVLLTACHGFVKTLCRER